MPATTYVRVLPLHVVPARGGTAETAETDYDWCNAADLQWLHPHVITLQHEQPGPLYELRVLLHRHEPLHHSIGPVLHRELTPGVTLGLQGVRTEGGELPGQCRGVGQDTCTYVS